MSAANVNKYRTTRDIIVPKGSLVIYVARMKQDVERVARAIVRAGPDMHFDWQMFFDDALRAGLIEKIPDGP